MTRFPERTPTLQAKQLFDYTVSKCQFLFQQDGDAFERPREVSISCEIGV